MESPVLSLRSSLAKVNVNGSYWLELVTMPGARVVHQFEPDEYGCAAWTYCPKTPRLQVGQLT